ncbi:MAG: ACP S-malonyltransferase [Bacillota bacterium]
MKLAFVFPGQGAQTVGMGLDFATRHQAAAEIFQTANDSLGYDLAGLIASGPIEELSRTEITQPAILTASLAALAALQSELPGLVPDGAAGLSLGEYAALVAADAITPAAAIPLVRLRGRYMQEAVPLGQGTMAAILGLEAEQVEEVCRQASAVGVVEPANYNCPGQLVISGDIPAVEEACRLALAAGARRAQLLAVSAPFHSRRLEPAGRNLAPALEGVTWQRPAFPVLSNVTAAPQWESHEIISNLVAQVSSPVRWEQTIRRFIAEGVDHFVEIGPGRSLGAMTKKIDRSVWTGSVSDLASLAETVAYLKETKEVSA